MKSLESIKRNSIELSNIEFIWDCIYLKIRKILEVPEDFEVNYKYSIKKSSTFEIDYLTYFIRDFLNLDKEKIWENSFEFSVNTWNSCYGKEITTVRFKLKGKNTLLNQNISSLEVLENQDKYKKFLEFDNETYLKLLRISKIFPVDSNNCYEL